jgi:catechol 2,3-dioxygenase-like lactoylglutathione lyase family enzyme
MAAKITHIAILSENYLNSGEFYQWAFGLRTLGEGRLRRASVVWDGYAGLNINPRSSGRPARLDHFGIDVDDIEGTCKRIASAYPDVHWVARPPSRPFASTTTHDPDGNVFDLSQKSAKNRADVYAANADLTTRHFDHIGLRALNPERLAEFYVKMFDFTLGEKKAGDENYYVSDGHLTLVIMPWRIADFTGMGIVSPGLDHIGFAVENLEKFKADVDAIAVNTPRLAPFPYGKSPESKARLELARASCPLCVHPLSDVDGVLLEVRESAA